MDKLIERIRRQPKRAIALVTAVVVTLIAFDVPIDDKQNAAIIGLATAALGLAAHARSKARAKRKRKP